MVSRSDAGDGGGSAWMATSSSSDVDIQAARRSHAGPLRGRWLPLALAAASRDTAGMRRGPGRRAVLALLATTLLALSALASGATPRADSAGANGDGARTVEPTEDRAPSVCDDAGPPPDYADRDEVRDVHRDAVDCILALGIAVGSGGSDTADREAASPAIEGSVARDQMASFLTNLADHVR